MGDAPLRKVDEGEFLSQSVVSAFLLHFYTLLDVLTIVDHMKADSESLARLPLTVMCIDERASSTYCSFF